MRHVHVVVLDAVVVVVVLFEYSIIRLFDYLPFLLSAVRGAGKREFIQDITVRVPQSVDADISCLASE